MNHCDFFKKHNLIFLNYKKMIKIRLITHNKFYFYQNKLKTIYK